MLYCLYCSNLSNINFKKVLTKVKKKKKINAWAVCHESGTYSS